jgi:hypothetical protein
MRQQRFAARIDKRIGIVGPAAGVVALRVAQRLEVDGAMA